MLSGRATLCAVFRAFNPTGRDFKADALQDVYDLQIANHSMEALQAYCSQLDALVLRCTGEQPSVDSMTNKFYEQVKGLPPILRDIQDCDRMQDDDADRTYSWLRRACDRTLDRWKAAAHRTVYAASLRSRRRAPRAPVIAPPPVGACLLFERTGRCRYGTSCQFAHITATRHSTKVPRTRSTAPSAPAVPAAPAASREEPATVNKDQSDKRALRPQPQLQ